MNANLMFAQGAGLMPQGQPRQQVVMFPHQQFPPPGHVPAMAYGAARHDLPAAQAPNQKYHPQPQQPSTQLQPKAQSNTKRATKALLIVDPDTNKPLDLEQLQELPTQGCLTDSLSPKVMHYTWNIKFGKKN